MRIKAQTQVQIKYKERARGYKNSGGSKRFFFYPTRRKKSGAHPASGWMNTRVLPMGQSDRRVKLYSHLYPVPGLRVIVLVVVAVVVVVRSSISIRSVKNAAHLNTLPASLLISLQILPHFPVFPKTVLFQIFFGLPSGCLWVSVHCLFFNIFNTLLHSVIGPPPFSRFNL